TQEGRRATGAGPGPRQGHRERRFPCLEGDAAPLLQDPAPSRLRTAPGITGGRPGVQLPEVQRRGLRWREDVLEVRGAAFPFLIAVHHPGLTIPSSASGRKGDAARNPRRSRESIRCWPL